MGFKDSGWRPKGAMYEYNGYEVWDHDHGPHHVNEGEVDGDVSIDVDDEDAE